MAEGFSLTVGTLPKSILRPGTVSIPSQFYIYITGTPQGVLPLLTIEGEGIDGKATVVQSNAIARCIARQFSKCYL